MSIKNFKIHNINPKENDKDIIKLLPTMLIPYEVSLELHDVNVAIANGIRRVMLSEIPVKALKFRFNDFKTTDPFILVDFILSRIRNIPINQNIPINTILELDVINNTEDVIHIKTKDLKIIKGSYSTHTDKKLPFNETYTIAMLNPNKSLKITNIYIKSNYGYKYGGYSVACNARSIPIDIEPYNSFTKEGVKSSVSDPKKFRLTWCSNGNMSANDIFKLSCDEIINRLNNIKTFIDSIELHKDISILRINKESDTIGNILIKSICDDYPNISAATYNCNNVTHELIIRIRKNDNATDIINKTIDKNVKLLEKIKKLIIIV